MTRSPSCRSSSPTKDVERTVESCLAVDPDPEPDRPRGRRRRQLQPDRTFEIAVSTWPTPRSRPGPERSAQRNLAVERAGGEYVLWIDADMMLTPGWSEDAVAAAERTEPAVFIPEVTVGHGFSRLSRPGAQVLRRRVEQASRRPAHQARVVRGARRLRSHRGRAGGR